MMTMISDCSSLGVVAKLTSKESEHKNLTRENIGMLSGYGDNLMEIVCRDACDGHDACRVSVRVRVRSMS